MTPMMLLGLETAEHAESARALLLPPTVRVSNRHGA